MAWLSWSGQFCPPHRLQVSWSGRTLRELPARLLFRSMRCPAKGKAGQGSCASMPIPCISRRQSILRLGARSAPYAIGQGRWFAPDKPALSMRRSRQPLIDIGDVGRHQSFAEDGDYHRPLLSPEHLRQGYAIPQPQSGETRSCVCIRAAIASKRKAGLRIDPDFSLPGSPVSSRTGLSPSAIPSAPVAPDHLLRLLIAALLAEAWGQFLSHNARVHPRATIKRA
jgi:hypothetical protein